MKLSLAGKLIALNVGLAAAVSVFIGVSVTVVVFGHLNHQEADELRWRAEGVRARLEARLTPAGLVAAGVASRADLPELMQKPDGALADWIRDTTRPAGVTALIVADASGRVLAEQGEIPGGTALLLQALGSGWTGASHSGAVPVGEAGLVWVESRPVPATGTAVGQVVAVVDLVGNHEFTDRTKADFEAECTVFRGDTRVSTTIQNQGRRAIGTRMQDPRVIQRVLQEGAVHEGVTRILGEDFQTVYWPLPGTSGKPAGMVFLGQTRA